MYWKFICLTESLSSVIVFGLFIFNSTAHMINAWLEDICYLRSKKSHKLQLKWSEKYKRDQVELRGFNLFMPRGLLDNCRLDLYYFLK